MLGITGHSDARRNKNASEHRDHNGEQAVPLDPDEVILQRHDDEETPEERAMVATPCGDEGHVLAHGEERNDAEENERPDAPDEDGGGEDGAHLPPGADACVEVVNRGTADARLLAATKNAANDARNGEEAEYTAE